MSEPPRRLFLLDGHSLAYRAFFALPQTLATSSGTITNAVYGFTSMLIKLLGDEHPDLLAVAFDMGAPTVRLEMDADYKAGRAETPADFRPQLGLIEEVLDVLHIPVIRMAGHEADDAIGTLATQASAQGFDVVIVTADRDFFQLVRERDGEAGAIGVLFNRRGISEIDRMDPAAVEAKYGVTPAQYLDFVALKGDTSDNIPGVPGVGEKTAAKLVQTFGSVEELLAHTDQLKGKQKENVEAAADRLALNKQLARIVTDVDLDVTPDDCVMGAYDPEQVRGLFTSLEFRSLLDRLYEATGSMKPVAEVAELDLRQVSVGQVGTALAGGAAAVVLRLDDGVIRGAAISAGGAQASYADLADLGPLAAPIADAAVSKLTHDSKALERAVTAAGGELAGVTFDTLIGAYLLDPGTTDYGLSAVSERYLGTDLLAGIDEGDGGQLFDEDPWRRTAAMAATVGLLVPVMEEQIDKQGLGSLLTDVELPLSSVLARMEARGIRLDGAYLDEMGEGVRDRMATRKAEIYERAGREFNLNSPPQLREVLYGELGLQPGKKTPKGELSTDASVLEKLRDEHPIVDALLAWRELDKLNSTYLEALPKLADAGGRIHTTFNQAAAATGRLSSTNPNLQNIPVRSELGREIRRAFVPGEPRPGAPGRRLLPDRAAGAGASLGRRGAARGVRRRRGHPCRDGREGVRSADRPRRRRAPPPSQGRQLRPRLRDERVGARAAARHRAGRGAGDHRRILRRVPEDQGVPGRAGRAGAARRLHRNAARATPLHPRAHQRQPAASRAGGASGAQRPDPGRRLRRVQDGDDRGGPGVARHARPGLPHALDGARRARLRGAGNLGRGRCGAGARSDGARDRP